MRSLSSGLGSFMAKFIFVALLCVSSNPVSAQSLEARQQAGGVLERAVVVGDYLYQPQGMTLSVWHLQASGAPTFAGISEAVPGTITGLTQLGGELFVCWRNPDLAGGLSRFSLADPARPGHVGDLIYSQSTFRDPQSVVAVGGLLYLADGEGGGLFVIDPADPENASVAVDFFFADEMVLEGTRLTAWARSFLGSLQVTLFDVSTPSAPVQLPSFDAGQMLRGAVDNGRFAAVGPEGLKIFDTSDPANIVQSFHDPNVANSVPLSVQINGSTLFFGVADGLHVWDISTPASASEATVVSAPTDRTMGAIFQNTKGSSTGYFLTETGRGLRFDTSSPLSPAFESAWDLPVGADSTAVAVVDGVAYVADFYSGLRLASAASLGQSLGRLDGSGGLNAFEDLKVSGKHTFLADWGSGLVIVDTSNVNAPNQVGTLPLAFPNAVDVSGDLAFLVSSTNGGNLYVVDVQDVSNPMSLSTTPIGQGSDVLVHDGLLLVADRAFGADAGLRIFDVSVPGSPQQLGHYTDCGAISAVAAQDDLAYVVCADGFLDVVDISTPASPVRVGRFEDPVSFSGGRGAVLSGERLIAALGGGLRIFDVSGGGDPVLLESIPLASSVRGLSEDSTGGVWIAAGLDGLYHLAEPAFFADGFESGDLSAWSTIVP